MASLFHSILLPRTLSPDNKINLIIGILTIIIGILSAILAWSTWRLTRDRRQRLGHESPPIDIPPLGGLQRSGTTNMGYELAFRFGTSL